MLKNLDRRWLCLIPFLLVYLLFLPLLRASWTWEDVVLVGDLAQFRDPPNWLFAMRGPTALSVNHFRPVAILVLLFQLRLGDLSPVVVHTTSILLHASNAMLIALLAHRLLIGKRNEAQPIWLPILLSLLYALHPALVEALALASAQPVLLMTTLLLLVLLVDLSMAPSWRKGWVIGGLALLGMLSHEAALALPIVYPLWRLAVGDQSLSASFRGLRSFFRWDATPAFLCIVLAEFLYLGFRFLGLTYLFLPVQVELGSLFQHVLLVFRSMSQYALIMFFPFIFSSPYHHLVRPIPLSDFSAWLSVGAVLGVFILLVLLMRRQPQAGGFALAGGVLLLTVANVWPLDLLGKPYIADRLLVLPMVFFALSLAPFLRRLPRTFDAYHNLPATLIFGLSIALLLMNLVTLQLTLPQWMDNLELWSWTTRKQPTASYPLVNLAREHLNQGREETGLSVAQYAVELDAENAEAWHLTGVALLSLERYEEALDPLRQATDMEPYNALYLNNLASAYLDLGDLEEAESILKNQVLLLNPSLVPGYVNLARVYMMTGRPDLAAETLEEMEKFASPSQLPELSAIQEELGQPDPWLSLGWSLLSQGDIDGASQAFDRAEVFGAPALEVGLGRAQILLESGSIDEAESLLLTLATSAPNDARVLNLLGIVAEAKGDLEQAREYFQRALILSPDWEVPMQNLKVLEGEGEE